MATTTHRLVRQPTANGRRAGIALGAALVAAISAFAWNSTERGADGVPQTPPGTTPVTLEARVTPTPGMPLEVLIEQCSARLASGESSCESAPSGPRDDIQFAIDAYVASVTR